MKSEAAAPRPVGIVGPSVAAVMWGFAGILAALTNCSGVTVTFWRLLGGLVLYGGILAATRRRITVALVRSCLPGGVLFAGDMVLFFSAIKLTSIAIVSVIGAMQPAVVFLVARRVFGERRTGRDALLMIVALGGVALTIVGDSPVGPDHLSGDLLAAVSMLFWSAYWVASKKARDTHGSVEYSAGVALVAFLVLVPVTLVADHGTGHLTERDWLLIALIAVIPGSGHLIMNWAHRYVAASLSSVIGNLNALVATVAAVPILGQSLTPLQGVGVVVALGAAVTLAASHREEAPARFD